MEGIPTKDFAALLSFRDKFSWNVMSHVVLPEKFQAGARQKDSESLEKAKRRRLPKSAFRGMLMGLRHWVAGLSPKKGGRTAWQTYSVENTYSDEETQAKLDFVKKFAAAAKPSLLWDMGCNTGVFSQAALSAGAKEVIGFDFDHGALEAAYQRASDENLLFQPLFLDAANPSPSQGWLDRERKGLNERADAKALLALAFIHHLVIGRNIPMAEAVGWLVGLAPQGIIEFVEKSDPTVERMLQFREDIFFDYCRRSFLSALDPLAEIVEQKEITQDGRLLVWYRRRA